LFACLFVLVFSALSLYLQLREINERLDQAKRLMQRIWRGLLKNKGVQALIILLLLAMIFLIVYLKWFYRRSDWGPNVTPTPNIPVNRTKS
jgi:hypothetical protein